MFQYQIKLYNFTVIYDDFAFQKVLTDLYNANPDVAVLDTETTGLDIMKDKPFLVGVGYNKEVFVFEPTKQKMEQLYEVLSNVNYVFAHNAKFDYHMLINFGAIIPDSVNIVDSLTVARLTEYSDSDITDLTLEGLGKQYVGEESKFAGDVIKEHVKKIDADRWKAAKKVLKTKLKRGVAITPIVEAYYSRIPFIPSEYDEYFSILDEAYVEATYEDSYKENPDLMRSYLADDCVILLEYLRIAIPILNVVDPNYTIFNQESKLLRVTANFERNGLRANVDYLVQSHYKLQTYIASRYEDLWSITKRKFSSGQHKEIAKYFLEVHSIKTESVDKKHLKALLGVYNSEVDRVIDIILDLRRLDKWLSTYVDGMLKRVRNGRIHTDIKSWGTVTGRVSSDMQQQPKEALEDKEGNELFHPRRVFINDEGERTFYFDYSQMELRMQAHYTLLTSDGDTNLCRAFMPFKCTNSDGIEFVYTGQPIDGTWFTETGEVWKKTDLHSVTALKAFPHITKESPDFDHYRRLGKVANFLKNYAGGKEAIMEQLDIDEEMAGLLDKAYYQAFPKVRDYQRWVDKQMNTYGYVENLYGRRYYIQNKRLIYKTYNYIVQGGCADLMKEKEILVHDYLKKHGLKTRILLPVHDELQLSIPKDEEWIVPVIKGIMDDNGSRINTLPMICDVEVTNTNWAEKEDYEI